MSLGLVSPRWKTTGGRVVSRRGVEGRTLSGTPPYVPPGRWPIPIDRSTSLLYLFCLKGFCFRLRRFMG